MNGISVLLKSWRAMCRYSIRDAARVIGVNISTLSRIENGKPMSVESFRKVMNWLLSEYNPPETDQFGKKTK